MKATISRHRTGRRRRRNPRPLAKKATLTKPKRTAPPEATKKSARLAELAKALLNDSADFKP